MSMQERLLQEARRRRGRATVNLTAVSKSLLLNQRVTQALRSHPVFQPLDTLQLSVMAYGGHHMRLKRYGVLYRSGASSLDFYVLLQGSVQLVSDDCSDAPSTVAPVRGSPCEPLRAVVLGVECLSSDGMQRRATAIALEPSELISFSVRGANLGNNYLERMSDALFATSVLAALQETPLFMDLKPHILEKASFWFQGLACAAGESIYVEGGECDRLFILLTGAIDVTKRFVHIATLDAALGGIVGGLPFFGVAGLLEPHCVRPCDVRAMSSCTLLVLSVPSFRKLLKHVPDFGSRLDAFVATRQRAWELEAGVSLALQTAEEYAQDPHYPPHESSEVAQGAS